MKILVDVAHPAHVHYFRNLAKNLEGKHDFLFTARKKECAKELMDHYNIKHIIVGENKRGLINKILNTIIINLKLLKISNIYVIKCTHL